MTESGPTPVVDLVRHMEHNPRPTVVDDAATEQRIQNGSILMIRSKGSVVAGLVDDVLGLEGVSSNIDPSVSR